MFNDHLGAIDPPLLSLLSSGALAGVSYWTSSYPIDVIKSRMQGQRLIAPGKRACFDLNIRL